MDVQTRNDELWVRTADEFYVIADAIRAAVDDDDPNAITQMLRRMNQRQLTMISHAQQEAAEYQKSVTTN